MRVSESHVVSMLFFLSAISLSSAEIHTEEINTLRNDISVIRTKIDETRKNIDHISNKAKSDSLSYMRYIQESEERARKISSERDSLVVLSRSLQNRRDSIAVAAEMSASLKNSFKQQTDQVLKELRSSCRKLITTLEPFEHFNISKQISALRFLEGEIAAGTVEATEGLERYWQIASQIEKASQKIETWTAPSPVQSIKGEAGFLRLGFIWLTFIDNENNRAFLWNSQTNTWDPVSQADQVASIHKAILLCKGMAAPQLVALPVSLKILPNKKGNEQ